MEVIPGAHVDEGCEEDDDGWGECADEKEMEGGDAFVDLQRP